MTAAPLAAIALQFAAILAQFAQSETLLAHIADAAGMVDPGNVLPDFCAVAVKFPGMRLRPTRHQACGSEWGDQNQLSHKIWP